MLWRLVRQVVSETLDVVGAITGSRAPQQTSWTPAAYPPPRPVEPDPAPFRGEDPGLPDLTRRLRAGARVLDLGCGLGRNLTALARQGFTPVGLDRSRRAAGVVRGDGHEVLVADLQRLPLRDASVDAVLAWQVLCQFAVGDAA